MADTPIPEGLTEAVANVYNAMEFDDLELQEMVMLAIAQGILAERAAQAERIRELEEAHFLIVHTFTEDSHGNLKTMPATYYQDISRRALRAKEETR